MYGSLIKATIIFTCCSSKLGFIHHIPSWDLFIIILSCLSSTILSTISQGSLVHHWISFCDHIGELNFSSLTLHDLLSYTQVTRLQLILIIGFACTGAAPGQTLSFLVLSHTGHDHYFRKFIVCFCCVMVIIIVYQKILSVFILVIRHIIHWFYFIFYLSPFW